MRQKNGDYVMNPKQIQAIGLLCDFEGLLRENGTGMRMRDVVNKIGVDYSTFWRWMNEDSHIPFRDAYYKAHEDAFKKVSVNVDKALLNACYKGNVNAMSLFYKLSGKLVDRTETKITDITPTVININEHKIEDIQPITEAPEDVK